eukprot:31048_1
MHMNDLCRSHDQIIMFFVLFFALFSDYIVAWSVAFFIFDFDLIVSSVYLFFLFFCLIYHVKKQQDCIVCFVWDVKACNNKLINLCHFLFMYSVYLYSYST